MSSAYCSRATTTDRTALIAWHKCFTHGMCVTAIARSCVITARAPVAECRGLSRRAGSFVAESDWLGRRRLSLSHILYAIIFFMSAHLRIMV